MGKIESVIEQLKSILKNDRTGLTIQELSERTKSSRITTALALVKLEGTGKVDARAVGNCKLHYWKTKRQ